jgi:hypothetical protein
MTDIAKIALERKIFHRRIGAHSIANHAYA